MTLTQMAVDILTTSDPHLKVLKSKDYSDKWFASNMSNQRLEIWNTKPPSQPSRPKNPLLLPPRNMPKRKYGT